MRIPNILGNGYCRDLNQYHIRIWQAQKPPEIIFALFYNKMNKNTRRRCENPPSWIPGSYRTESDAIFVFGNLKNPQI